jgi:hypothetical protein
MKSVKVTIEGKKEFEIMVDDKDLETLEKVIKVFESGKMFT